MPLSIAVNSQRWGLLALCISVTIALLLSESKVQFVAASMSRKRDSSCTMKFMCTWDMKSINSSAIFSFAPSCPIPWLFYVVSRLCASCSLWPLPPSIGPSSSTRLPCRRRLQYLSHLRPLADMFKLDVTPQEGHFIEKTNGTPGISSHSQARPRSFHKSRSTSENFYFMKPRCVQVREYCFAHRANIGNRYSRNVQLQKQGTHFTRHPRLV